MDTSAVDARSLISLLAYLGRRSWVIAFNPVEGGEELDVVDLHPLGTVLIVAFELSWSQLLKQVSQWRRGRCLDWALRDRELGDPRHWRLPRKPEVCMFWSSEIGKE